MKAIKMNNADNYESIHITLSRENTPIAYQNKLDELIDCMAFDTPSDAEKWLSETPIELELYYENGYGLFGVEPEAVENMETKSPYSGAPILDENEIDQFNEDDKQQYSNNYIQSVLNDDMIKSIINCVNNSHYSNDYIQDELNNDFINSVINCENNSQEIQEDKIEEIRNIIFRSITGKNLD